MITMYKDARILILTILISQEFSPFEIRTRTIVISFYLCPSAFKETKQP